MGDGQPMALNVGDGCAQDDPLVMFTADQPSQPARTLDEYVDRNLLAGCKPSLWREPAVMNDHRDGFAPWPDRTHMLN